MKRHCPTKTGSAASTEPRPPQARRVAPSRGRVRLDVALVERGLVPSREQAARLILAGAARVDGRLVDKPGALVETGAALTLAERQRFVSRGGDKLAHALGAFAIPPRERICLDVGASTGGFTHCLLEAGAARVYALDVGQGQLDASLRSDPRVVVMERVNARQLSPALFPDRPALATVDVSFISLEKVLPSLSRVLARDGEVVALVKPQFEVGRGRVGKRGVVREASQHQAVLWRLARFAVLRGWHVLGVTASPLKGPKGNREFFLHLAVRGRTVSDLGARIARAVEEAPE